MLPENPQRGLLLWNTRHDWPIKAQLQRQLQAILGYMCLLPFLVNEQQNGNLASMSTDINNGHRRSALTTAPLVAPVNAGASSPIPETFRLPRQHERDPYWGLSRAWYYGAEKAGLIKLIRLRKVGLQRGVTLVPYHDVAAFIRSAADQI